MSIYYRLLPFAHQPICDFTKPHLPREVSAFDSVFFFAITIGDEMRDDAITVIVRFVLRSCCLPGNLPPETREREGEERDDVRRRREGWRRAREELQ